jgi:NAD(P)-dependent dehydrogenase (short-subunit alcohol dehydrogenase family)
MTDAPFGPTTDPPTHGNGIDLVGARVVITGAAGGIGSALARALASRGARLLLTDRAEDAVASVAAELDASWCTGDVADESDVRTVVDLARDVLGGVDLFCGNAGVALPGSLDPVDFEISWRVNVMAHVHAVNALLPDWLAAGRGRYLMTVSAAGVLSMLGNAPYSVTKHGALAFAEWLRMTYAHRGVTVQALCPQGVRTAILTAADPRSAAVLESAAIEPGQVADDVLAALRGDQFLILPHPEVADFAVRRATDPDRWLAGMNRAQQRLEQAFPQEVST